MDTTNRIRVVHVAECIGGVDRYLHNLLKYMNHEKFENIMVLSKLYKNKGYDKMADRVEIIDIPHGMGAKTLASTGIIRRLVKKYNPDVVCAHSSVAGAVTRMACIGLGVKVLYNPHGWSFNMQSGKRKVFVALEKLMAPFCDGIICISDAEKKSALEKKICKENKLHVIYNGIDLDEYHEVVANRKDLGVPENAFVVGMVGRISQQKAPDVFVRMAAEINKRIENAFFIIVGDVVEGDFQQRIDLDKLIKELDVDIMITGWVDNPLDYVKQFDVACLLSRWEGFGLVIPEYMLCEKPVVATRVDAIPFVVEGAGLLVDKDNWKNAAEKVIKLKEDKILYKNLAKAGANRVRVFFDIKNTVEKYEILLKNVLE